MKASINITGINEDIQKAVFVNESQEVPSVGDKTNADTLDGHDVSYFAKASDVTALNKNKANQSEVDALKKQVADLTALVNKMNK